MTERLAIRFLKSIIKVVTAYASRTAFLRLKEACATKAIRLGLRRNEPIHSPNIHQGLWRTPAEQGVHDELGLGNVL